MFFYMGVNSIRAENLSPLVLRILNKKEANIFGQFLCVCSSTLISFIQKIPLWNTGAVQRLSIFYKFRQVVFEKSMSVLSIFVGISAKKEKKEGKELF